PGRAGRPDDIVHNLVEKFQNYAGKASPKDAQWSGGKPDSLSDPAAYDNLHSVGSTDCPNLPGETQVLCSGGTSHRNLPDGRRHSGSAPTSRAIHATYCAR